MFVILKLYLDKHLIKNRYLSISYYNLIPTKSLNLMHISNTKFYKKRILIKILVFDFSAFGFLDDEEQFQSKIRTTLMRKLQKLKPKKCIYVFIYMYVCIYHNVYCCFKFIYFFIWLTVWGREGDSENELKCGRKRINMSGRVELLHKCAMILKQ